MERAQATSSHNLTLAAIAGFTLSIFVSSFLFISPLVSVLIFFVSSAVLLAEKIQKGNIEREIAFLSIILIFFSLGAMRYSVKDFHEARTPTSSGVVVSEPEEKDNAKSFVMLSDNGEKVLVSTSLYADVNYGDKVEVNGKIEAPGVIQADDGRSFDYGAYLSKDDIYYTERHADVKILGSGYGNPIKSALLRIKNDFIEHARRVLPEPYASLLMGLIVAGKDALPKEILDEFRNAGVIHIVVLSGYNITLIAEFLRKIIEKFFLFIKIRVVPQAAAAASIVGIVLFTLMTGATATVVRAAIMAVVAISSKLFGRSYSASRALIFAAFVMLLENPKILVFDPSFQLSFLATLGLILFMPVMERNLQWVTERWKMRETLAQTLATQFTVLPLLIYSTGLVSLVSIPANLLILVFVPLTMLLGFVAVLLSYISSIIAWPTTYVSYLLLKWILFVPHFLGSLPFATLAIPDVSIWLIVIIYMAMIVSMNITKLTGRLKVS